MPAAVAPPPTGPDSITVTRQPRRARLSAQAAPTMPAPMTTARSAPVTSRGCAAAPMPQA